MAFHIFIVGSRPSALIVRLVLNGTLDFPGLFNRDFLLYADGFQARVQGAAGSFALLQILERQTGVNTPLALDRQ